MTARPIATSSALAPIDLARLEEARLARALADCSVEHAPFAGGVLGFGGPGSWQNGAYGAGLAGEVDEEEIERFCAFYRERGVEPRIELAPFAHESLVQGLAARGFVIREFESVLFRELGPETPDIADLDPALVVRVVDQGDEVAVRHAVEISNAGFRAEGEPPNEVSIASLMRAVVRPYVTCFVAELDGEPVGGGMVEVHRDIAALFGASTMHGHRRRGVHRALFAARLAHARAAGCRVASIGSIPGASTERNAMRCGFRTAYTKVILRQPAPGLSASP